ncbi:MAG: hypothetical protein ABFD92_05700 [Planctomycetaceae bacterium]
MAPRAGGAGALTQLLHLRMCCSRRAGTLASPDLVGLLNRTADL